MPFRVPPSRVAAALDFIGQLRDRAGGILNTVASTPGTLRPDEYQERFGLPGDPVPAPREVGRTVRGAATRFTSLDAPQNPTFAEMAAETGASFVPGVGQLLAARDIERARRADDLAGMAMAASNFLPVDRLIGALRHGLGRPPISELDVYHGTPHTYAPTEANPLGEFDASKIGTGEGAQAYGHGIYLAETPEVASMYRASVGPKDGSQFDLPDGPIKGIATMIAAKGDEGEKAARKLWASSVDDIDEAVRLAREAVTDKSSLYKADLPDEMIDRMLDWDKPLSEQPAAVREALMKNPAVAAEVKRINAQREALNAQDPRRLTHPVISKLAKKETTAESLKGQALYELLAKGGNQAETSAYLRSLGIPGIKYLDAGSRGQGGTGTRNFVVFPGEEKKVKILERNGQPAPERIAQALEAAPTTARRPTALPTIKPGDVVDGYKVRPDIPNQSSIAASLDNYEVLPGIRSINMTEFDPQYVRSISPDKLDSRTRKLMDEISQSKELNPLIVAYDSKGPYIIEGGHRFDALAASKAKSVPAMVVIDMDDPPR